MAKVDGGKLAPRRRPRPCCLADGSEVTASLAVAADGRMSPAREAAGIATSARSYPQSALVLNFGHRREHGFTSTEFHTETGPFTQVPLPGNRSSLVWVVKPETAKELAALDDAALSVRVEQQMQSMLGRVSVEPGRQIYPLSACAPGASPRTGWRWSARPPTCFRRSARKVSISASGTSRI